MSREQNFRKPGKGEPVVESPGVVFENNLRKWLVGATDDTLRKFIRYNMELIKFNKAVNLIAPTTIAIADNVHFADSAYATQIVIKSLVPGQPLFDIGSGNGFPGMVMAILHPNVSVILVDRDERKAEFLKHIITVLQLKNVTVEISAVEDMAAGRMVNVVTRGFAPLHKAMLIARKQVNKGGRFFHLKGDGWANELASVPSQLFSYWTPSLLGQYQLPVIMSNMAVVLTEKIAE